MIVNRHSISRTPRVCALSQWSIVKPAVWSPDARFVTWGRRLQGRLTCALCRPASLFLHADVQPGAKPSGSVLRVLPSPELQSKPSIPEPQQRSGGYCLEPSHKES